MKLTDRTAILAEAIRLLKEQDTMGQQPMPGAPPPPPPPAAPTPTDPTQTAQPPADPSQQPAGGDVNKLVTQINDIRAGASTTAPEVFQALTQFYDALQPDAKTTLHSQLDSLVNAIKSPTGQQQQQDIQQNPRVGQQPSVPQGGAAPTPPAQGTAPVAAAAGGVPAAPAM
jgi:hypothetical protein